MDTKLLERIEATPGRNDKEALLATVDESTKRFIRWVVDQYLTFGVTVSEETSDVRMPLVDPPWWDEFDNLLTKLSKRELTGNDATHTVNCLFSCAPSVTDQMWARRILNKDLRVGVHVKSVVKVLPGLVEPFACALAHPYDPGKHSLDGGWAIEPKLDGLRCLVIDGKAVTRTGRPITSIGHILEALEDLSNASSDWVLDAEVMGADGTEFNEASGQVRQKSGTASGLVLNVFDCIARGEWAAKRTRTFKERRADLQRVLEFCIADSRSCVRVVPQTVVNSPSGAELFAARDAFMEQGFEGAMAKRLDASYNFKRSSDLLKIKSFLDADGVVVGVVEGRGKFKGMLGALVVDFDGVTTEVGSGFTDEQRRMLLANSQGILNKHVEVKFQNRTPDGKLRFPVFCRTRPDKD